MYLYFNSISSHQKRLEGTSLKRLIDHTLLRQDSSADQFEKLFNDAKTFDISYVCVPGTRAELALKSLQQTQTKIAAVIGFPHGNQFKGLKAFEAKQLFELGIHEVDMVIDIGRLKDKDYEYVRDDIKSVVDVAKSFNKNNIVKVIIETCLLTKEEIVDASILCVIAKADFVKTSTGFSTGGAKEEDVFLMKSTVGDQLEVKASGGIKTYNDAIKMIKCGASRLGTSSGVAIIEEELKQ